MEQGNKISFWWFSNWRNKKSHENSKAWLLEQENNDNNVLLVP